MFLVSILIAPLVDRYAFLGHASNGLALDAKGPYIVPPAS